MSSGSPLHRMMSQGINAVLAKTLLNIESEYKQRLDTIESKWNEQLRNVVDDYEGKMKIQSCQIELLRKEIDGLKEMFYPSHQGIVAFNHYDVETNENKNVSNMAAKHSFAEVSSVLNEKVEVLSEKITFQERVTSAIQDNIDDFVQLYENRNKVVDFVLGQHENNIKSTQCTIGAISQQYSSLSNETLAMKDEMIEKLNLLETSFDRYKIETDQLLNAGSSDLDEHHRLRMELESQIVECNMKYDHLYLTVQKQSEDYKRLLEEYEVVKGVAANRAKQRREKVLQDIQAKQRSILKQITGKDSEVLTDMVSAGNRKVRFNVVECNDDPACFDSDTGTSPKKSSEKFFNGDAVQIEMDDNDSEFGASISLVLLEELSIV